MLTRRAAYRVGQKQTVIKFVTPVYDNMLQHTIYQFVFLFT